MNTAIESHFSKTIGEMYTEELRNGGRSLRRVQIVGHQYNPWGQNRDFNGPVVLQPEPENQHDPCAIAVYTEDKSGKVLKVGHIARESTRLIREMVKDDLLFNGPSPTSVYIAYPES